MSNGSYHIGLYQNVLEGETREGVYAMIKKPVQQSSDQLVLSPPPLPPRGQQRPFPTQPVPSHFCHPLVADAKKGTVDKLPDCPKKTAKDAALFTLISNIPRYGILYRFGRGSKGTSMIYYTFKFD